MTSKVKTFENRMYNICKTFADAGLSRGQIIASMENVIKRLDRVLEGEFEANEYARF